MTPKEMFIRSRTDDERKRAAVGALRELYSQLYNVPESDPHLRALYVLLGEPALTWKEPTTSARLKDMEPTP